MLPAVLAYADNILIMATTVHEIAELLRPLLDELRGVGLEVNPEKGEALVRGPHVPEVLDGDRIGFGPIQVGSVTTLVYLRAIISSGPGRRDVIQQRVRKGQLATQGLIPALHRHPLPVRVLH